ncbi:MAG: DUF2760 domain-containing protein [Planctomycetes bacterium]|nr:DUF2760 domain-containing protein [Planctomycetota bacterium]
MGRVQLAFAVFFRVLANRETADRVASALAASDAGTGRANAERLTDQRPGSATSPMQQGARPAGSPRADHVPVGPPKAVRSEAVTLLATLQREARFVDLVHESLEGYADAQIGAAAREVLRDCRKVLDHCFNIGPVCETPEGDSHAVQAGYDPGVFRLVGKVASLEGADGSPAGGKAYPGKVVHRGWKVQQCQLPAWSGSLDAAAVIAAAEVEVCNKR